MSPTRKKTGHPEDAPQLPPVPTGIQSLLRLASVDATFREELVLRRADLAPVAKIPLTDSERAILGAIPDDQLREMAAKMPPPPPARRDFLRQTASTALVLLGGVALASTLGAFHEPGPLRLMGCNPMASGGGAAPDWPEEPVTTAAGDDDSAAGDDDSAKEAATPLEQHPARPEHTKLPTRGGAAPDLPADNDSQDKKSTP